MEREVGNVIGREAKKSDMPLTYVEQPVDRWLCRGREVLRGSVLVETSFFACDQLFVYVHD